MKRERVKFVVEVNVWYNDNVISVDSKEFGIKLAKDCLTGWSCSFADPVSAELMED